MTVTPDNFPQVGVVAIGRNEGERLRVCIESVIGVAGRVVYVDSGSTDGSVAMAREKGVEVVELDMSIPFTAARARNEGFRRLREIAPDIEYVQFVDGDCEIVDGWIHDASKFLDANADVAAVCGRLRERHPEQSVYNMLCDIEWDVPAGESKACGGNAMMRAAAFEKAGGFRADLIAGEEPELCIRLRAAGWRIWRLKNEMALHDAAMSRFEQWWQRAKRAGYTYAEGVYLHGGPPERHCVRQARSSWFWAVGFPVMIIAAAIFVHPIALLAFSIYPLQVARLALRGGRSARENWWRGYYLVLAKFPEMIGQLKFWRDRLSGKKSRLIEYK